MNRGSQHHPLVLVEIFWVLGLRAVPSPIDLRFLPGNLVMYTMTNKFLGESVGGILQTGSSARATTEETQEWTQWPPETASVLCLLPVVVASSIATSEAQRPTNKKVKGPK